MSGTESTPFSDKCNVLAELWMDYREEEGFKEIMSYGDLGFPLAFAISEDVVSNTPLAEQYITELWEMFLATLEIEDTGLFTYLEEMFELSKYKNF